jgi:uncharacterized glyoxalase superfamily protein PhnB
MHNVFLPFLGALGLAALSFAQSKTGQTKAASVKKVTPVLYVNEIEPCVKFWVERLGFQKTVEVPEGDRLGFVILQKGSVEIMYQSIASATKDAPAAALEINGGRTFLYVEVENFDATLAAMNGVPLVLPVRTTFYGAKEFGVKDPAGHVVVFAEMSAAPQK